MTGVAMHQREDIRLPSGESVIDVIRPLVASAFEAASPEAGPAWGLVAVADSRLRAIMSSAMEMRIDRMADSLTPAQARVEVDAARRHALVLAEAPVCLAVLLRPGSPGPAGGTRGARTGKTRRGAHAVRGLSLQAVGAVVQQIVAKAAELGYGAHWISAPRYAVDLLEELLELRPGEELASLVCIDPKLPPRRSPSSAAADGTVTYR